ncbi:MAG: HlyD family efflux transporter periplasmic adaptor subunit [Burkholderiaceae bacterium]|jgi:HlyD family secretion protein
MIRDTSSQDTVLARPAGKRRLVVAAAVVAVLALTAWSVPQARHLFAASGSVSAERLGLDDVTRGPFVRDIQAEGRVVAAFSPTLFAPQAGAVTLQVHAGDSVKKGQVLATIASPELAAKLAQETATADTLQTDTLRAQVEAGEQRAALQGARENAAIDVKAAETDLARQHKAFDAGAAAGMQVDHARDALEKARIALNHAEAGLHSRDDSLKFDVQAKEQAHARQVLLVDDLKRQVGELAVRSPVDGQVGQLFVAVRASVARDAQLLTVIDLTQLEVQMQVAESFARDLAVGMPGEITGNGQVWKARVSGISPEVVANQVAARLRFDDNPQPPRTASAPQGGRGLAPERPSAAAARAAMPEQLRQNQRLSVRVLLDQRPDVVSVRAGSFIDESGGQYAYVVRDGVAVKTAVRLGARSVDRVEILSGLKVGDRVVVSGADNFHAEPTVGLSH